MSLNVTGSSVSAANATSQVSGAQPSDNTMKSSTDSSCKDEMEKVSTKEEKKESLSSEAEVNDNKNTLKSDNVKSEEKTNLVKAQKSKTKTDNVLSEAEVKNMAALSMLDVNNRLQGDIERMMNTNGFGVDGLSADLLSSIEDTTFGKMFALDYTDGMFMSQSDAEFFINLAQRNDVSAQGVAAQAQMAFENGAELSQVQQNVKISETLLNAINTARENNQPLRIDFDNNVAVIMRFGKDGSFAANFIPGDKVVEQYLKNNIDSLKSAFDEKDIPYTDLSYSSRGREHQKEQQRNQQQQ